MKTNIKISLAVATGLLVAFLVGLAIGLHHSEQALRRARLEAINTNERLLKAYYSNGFNAGSAQTFITLSEAVERDWSNVTLRDCRLRWSAGGRRIFIPEADETLVFPQASQALAKLNAKP